MKVINVLSAAACAALIAASSAGTAMAAETVTGGGMEDVLELCNARWLSCEKCLDANT